MIKDVLSLFQLAVTCGNLIIMLYALSKFLKKPQNDLEDRVTVLEVKSREHDEALHLGNDRFREQKKADALIINSLVALIEFEVDYCMHHGDERISPRLDKAKTDLQEYLAER
jgi:hypothetical protein